MPFLRFSRDKRGYANTYLCHTFREDGIVRMRVLYWFRTPPDIAVGRPALDDEAIRDIETSNPDLTFDWDEILKAKPPPAPPDRGGGERQERRSRRRGRGVSIGAAGAPGADERAPARTAASPDAAAGSDPGDGEPPDETPAAGDARRGRRRRTPAARRRRRERAARPGRRAPAGPSETPTNVKADSEPA